MNIKAGAVAAAITLGVAALVTVPTTATAMHSDPSQAVTTVKPDWGQPYTVKPSTLNPGVVDGTWYFTDINWTTWKQQFAKASAVEHKNNCIPNCATGKFTTRKVNLLLDHASGGHFQNVQVIYKQTGLLNTVRGG